MALALPIPRPLLLALACPPPPSFYHIPLPSGDHRVTDYLFRRSWTALALSPIPVPPILSRTSLCLALPAALLSLTPWPLSHPPAIGSSLRRSWMVLTRSLPIPVTLSLALLPHYHLSISAFIDGSRALPPSIALPICLLPSRAPSSALPLALLLSHSPPPSPSSLSLFPTSIAVHLPTNKGTSTLFTALTTISDNT